MCRRIRFQGAQNVLEGHRLTVMHQKEVRDSDPQAGARHGITNRSFSGLQTRYDPLSSCLVDFKGRATAASVKNFQLVKSFPEDKEQRATYYGPTGTAGLLEHRD